MENIIILFFSSASAVRMKDALIRKGYPAKVIATPSRLAEGGCGYSVKTSVNAASEAKNLIADMGLRSRGIYIDTQAEGENRYRRLPLA